MNNSTETENEIFEIPEWNMDRLNKAISKMNKRAEKFDLPPIDILHHGKKLIVDTRYVQKSDKITKDIPYEQLPKIVVCCVSLSIETISLSGYEFLGTLDHITLPGKVVVNTVPGKTIPPSYFHKDAICDHCGKIRRRNQTFVLKNSSGHHVQVGRQCLKDFLDVDPSAIVRMLTVIFKFVQSLTDDDDWFEGGYGYGVCRDWCFPHEEVLKMTAVVIRTYGWVPRSASEDREATADIVQFALLPPQDSQSQKRKKRMMAELKWDEKADERDASESAEWLKKQEPTNEYINNLQQISDAESVPLRMFGYWCSLVATYQRSCERLRMNMAQQKTNAWVGNVKDKIQLDVKVMGIRYIDGPYGVVRLFKMLDNNGHTVNWFASCDPDMKEDSSYTIIGTVKKHDEYNDWKQTILTRVKVLKEIENESE